LKKGTQKESKPDSEPQKRKGTAERKIYFEESESDLPARIEEH
jgi:hypothetical protein